ncbi:MAG: urea transporter [Deltaproteobacteria bacterium]|nr:urea transporter [Deltaproteobacteria bacterium]
MAPVSALAARAGSAAEAAAPRRLAPPAFVSAALRAYAQVLFLGRRRHGLLLLAATLLEPRVGLHGLAAVLAAQVLARALQLGEEATAGGLHGYNPLLVGLAVGASFEPGPATAALLLLAVGATVFLEAALQASLGAWLGLPVLSLPFLGVTWLALAAAPSLGPVARAVPALVPPAPPAWLPEAAWLYLRSMGAMLFSPGAATGALVALALLLHSRIALLLSLAGFGIAWVLAAHVFTFASDPSLLLLHANAALVAVALGGVWFVPQASSFLLAAAAVLVTALFTAGSLPIFRAAGLPVLFLPFDLAVLVVLAAMRQRTRDGSPKSVDFAAGAPEANLAHYRTRLARFGPGPAIRMAPPFSGRWTVTQGVDGPHTHRGAWRHALDFEVLDAAGRRHTGTGTQLRDHLCYRLPVLAPADGTVVKVVTDRPDNPPGELATRDPWGNLVLLHHGPGLYSLVAHLAPASSDLREGQTVRQGARLGLCGNSGRSFVPHLHFQLQATARLGAPTLELALADAVVEEEGVPRLHRSLLPSEGQALRGLTRQDDLAELLAFPLGRRWTWLCREPGGRELREAITSEISLTGELYLASADGGGRLWFETLGRQLLVYDHLGPRRSVLHLLAAALPRVPYELPAGLRWDDVLPRRRFRPAWARWAADLADPFLAQDGLVMRYRAERNGVLQVRGEGRLGGRTVETGAVVLPGRGPVELWLQVGRERWSACAVEEEEP